MSKLVEMNLVGMGVVWLHYKYVNAFIKAEQ